MTVPIDDVVARLREVYDPEIGINIVDLGLVYEVEVEEDYISVLMTLTSPGCPLGDAVENSVRGALSDLPGADDVRLQITFDPPWTPQRMSRMALAALGWPVDD